MQNKDKQVCCDRNKGIVSLFIILVVVIAGAASFSILKTKSASPEKTSSEQEKQTSFGDLLNKITSPQELGKEKPEANPENSSQPETISNTPAPTNKPIPTGTIKGRVVGGYYSNPLSGAVVAGAGQTTTSGTDGRFTITNLPLGNYTFTVTHPDYAFSGFQQDVREGINTLNGSWNGFLKNPKPLSISGQTFVDKNRDNIKNGSDDGKKIFLILYNETGDNNWNQNQTIDTDNQGSFSFQVSDTGRYKLEPVSSTFYQQPAPVEFVVDGYGGSKTYSFPYYPTASEAGFTVYVFNDKNENRSRDSDEEYIHYQYVQITNTTTGENWNLSVSADGGKNSAIDYGNYNLKLVPQDSSWDYSYKITKGEAIVFILAESGQQTIELGAHKL